MMLINAKAFCLSPVFLLRGTCHYAKGPPKSRGTSLAPISSWSGAAAQDHSACLPVAFKHSLSQEKLEHGSGMICVTLSSSSALWGLQDCDVENIQAFAVITLLYSLA